ncbi:class II D-tagatose-bisphosphate aldolase, non-catalytic subunit [Serratia ureilytica]
MQQLLQLVEQHKAGMPVGIFSVCSAHPGVLRAALRQAKARGTPVLRGDVQPGQSVRRLYRPNGGPVPRCAVASGG